MQELVLQRLLGADVIDPRCPGALSPRTDGSGRAEMADGRASSKLVCRSLRASDLWIDVFRFEFAAPRGVQGLSPS